MNELKTAIVAGATGLVGEQLLNQLLNDAVYGKVIAIIRKPLDFSHAKLVQQVIDFGQLPDVIGNLKADHGFCCLGTTIKQAGTQEKQYLIDHDYVVAFARGCIAAGIQRFAVVSSVGANAASSNFYLRTKGEMERDLQTIPFQGLYILQPSLLLGERKEFRAGERTAASIMKVLNPFLAGGLKKYRGVTASAVAKKMVTLANGKKDGVKFVRSDEI
jgi:uncharacterized protein YbjT (DUF2867 family)